MKFFDFISQFYQESLTLSRQHSAQDKQCESQAHDEHAAVYQAIRMRDVDSARASARILLQNTVARMIDDARAPLARPPLPQRKVA